MKKIIKIATACVCVFAIASCSNKKASENEYTYHEAFGATPSEWNPHILGQDASTSVHSLSTIGWVSMGMKANKEYTWLNEMADSITDITSKLPAEERNKYGIVGDSKQAYEIKLNQSAAWENGTKITADDYIYSMKQLLNYDLKNAKAAQYIEGKPAIFNAKEYMYNGRNHYEFLAAQEKDNVTESDGYYYYDGKQLFYSMAEPIPDFGGWTLAYCHEQGFMSDEVYQNLLATPNDDGFIPLTASAIANLKAFMAGIYGSEDYWFVPVLMQSQYHATWDDVGFVKVNDYTLRYYLKSSCDLEDLYPYFSSSFLVYRPLYEGGKTTRQGLLATNYGTSVDTYMSFGPYKLVSFEAGKQMVFKKNDKWYGYSDNKHQGMYQTTQVIYDVIPSHETELNAFLSGKIEKTALTAADMKTYKFSDHLLKADESFIFYLSMNSNLAKLQELETAAGDGSNKRVGSYKTFKEALSYSINRLNFVNEGTAGSKAQYGLFNTLYYYDAKNDPSSIYRTSENGMKAIVDHYKVEYGPSAQYKTLEEAYQSINGFNLAKATALFQQTYEAMKADGNYTDGQLIKLNCVASDQTTLNEEKIMQQNLLNEYIDAATKGTGFENKISIKFMVSADQNMNKNFADGKVEMILTQKSGQETSPFTQIEKYTNKDNYTVPEIAAYDPNTETMTLTINGEEVTKTILDWSKSIRADREYGNDMAIRVMILSKIEQYLLDNYVNIPLYSRCNVFLNSKKINQGTKDYNLYYGFGGLPYITYNYNDAEWANYVKQNNNQLNYA